MLLLLLLPCQHRRDHHPDLRDDRPTWIPIMAAHPLRRHHYNNSIIINNNRKHNYDEQAHRMPSRTFDIITIEVLPILNFVIHPICHLRHHLDRHLLAPLHPTAAVAAVLLLLLLLLLTSWHMPDSYSNMPFRISAEAMVVMICRILVAEE